MLHQVFDANIFICNATNEAGYDTKTFDLTVHQPPAIINGSIDPIIIVNQGETIRLKCMVTGFPLPVVTWAKNRQPIIDFLDR